MTLITVRPKNTRTTHKALQNSLNKDLDKVLRQRKDDFQPGMTYVKKWHYQVDEDETVPYKKVNYEGKPINE